MIRIALVGNIASGKSTVQNFLISRGYPVLDTDDTAHKLLEDSLDVKNVFKDYDVFENGAISRVKLGQLIFSNKEMKTRLENILHPLIRKEIENFFNLNQDKTSVFVAIPLLFEASMEDLFDKVLFVYTDDEIRLERLMKRNNYTREYAQIRMNSQISQDEKINKADYVIYNNSTIDELESQLIKLLNE